MGNTDFIMSEDNGCMVNALEQSTENGGKSAYPLSSRFWKTKRYLHRVRDGIRRCSLLEGRINLRMHGQDGSGCPDIDELNAELKKCQQCLNDDKVEITDLISKLSDVNQQVVITERYVNMKTWEQIAQEMNTSVRSIAQKIHGKALPLLEKLIEEDEASDDRVVGE